MTLLEICVALALLAVLAWIAAPSVGGQLRALGLRAAALRLAAGVVRARAGAMAEGRAWRLEMVGDGAFAVGPDGEATAPETLPDGVRVVRATSGGQVLFRPSGAAENATFVLRAGAADRRVVVNQRGRVSIR